ncbi:MAG: hypothetical protein KatS3mg002_1222 [Candidatus Woesearchaeota archaeon]|nr:MAG: hypothetical protein KatS3mg002_1222 [Candidatus Woesearchaeota archaeon]
MSISLRRKLYPRGGSYETTIPMQLLFDVDLNSPNEVVFEYDKNSKKWYIRFEKLEKKSGKHKKAKS